MINKDRNWKEEYEDIENELLMDKVSKAIKEDPKNWQNNMEKIGFTWIDDSQDEIEEERNATPENVNQEYLVAYFEGEVKFSNNLIEIFIEETESEDSNYPLVRKYFKTGNAQLLHLLVSGLSNLPTEKLLLSGLGYFHEHRNILSQMISSYTDACEKETDIERFEDLCVDFINDTDADGYNAIAELTSIFNDNRKKLEVLEKIKKMMQDQDEIIEF